MNYLDTAWTAGYGVNGNWYKRKIDVLSGDGELCGTIVKTRYHGSDGWRRAGYAVIKKTPEGMEVKHFTIDRTIDFRSVQGGRSWFNRGTHETLRAALAAAKRYALGKKVHYRKDEWTGQEIIPWDHR
tara:strand:- start:263 stop:646 length:384 start_codon:yes stop_codon:yes gene_type:complete